MKYSPDQLSILFDEALNDPSTDGEAAIDDSSSRNGYKHSDFGWIPEEWGYVLLDSVAVRGSGHTPSKGIDRYYGGGIKWISLADSHRLDQGFIRETTIEISEEGLKNSSAVLHPEGTVVLSRDAGVGKSAIMAESMAVSQHFIVWKCSADLDNWFLYYLLQKRKPEFERIAIGSTIKTIGLPYFKKFKIPLPKTGEQGIIVNILSSWDIAIGIIQTLVAAKEQRKKWLMGQLLMGKKRLPGFGGEWERKRLGNYLQKHEEKAISSNQYPVLTSSRNGLFLQKEYYSGRQVASVDNTGYNVVPRGYFTYRHMSDDLLFRFNINCIVDKGIVSTLYPVFTVKGLSKEFVWYKLNEGKEFKNFSLQQKQGGSRTYMYFSNLCDLILLLPSIEEQTAIVQVLQVAEKEIRLLRQKLEKLKEQKKGLMQVLLTGKVRLRTAKQSNHEL